MSEGIGRLAPTLLRRTGGALALACVLLGALCGCPAPSALAAEAAPLAISSFTLQTTLADESVEGTQTKIVNEPQQLTQAGAHPEALTSLVRFASQETADGPQPTRDPKDVSIELPPGLSADPQAAARCPLAQVAQLGGEPCPADSQVGVYVVRMHNVARLGPIIDIAPEAGQPAELGLETNSAKLTFLMVGRLLATPRGYTFGIAATRLPLDGIFSVETTLWGVPADPSHDPQRGLFCAAAPTSESWSCEGGGEVAGIAPAPLLTLSSDCAAGPQVALAQADSWEQPGSYVAASATLPAPTGCAALQFAPTLEMLPETTLAGAPLGLQIDLQAAQDEGAQGEATPPLREVSVTLPQGVSLSPSLAAGLRACAAEGAEGIDMPDGLSASGEPLQPDEAGEGEALGLDGLAQLTPGHCPAAATIGSAEASTPLLAHPLQGRLFLAQPLCGGAGQEACTAAAAADGGLFRFYLELGGGSGEAEEGSGLVIKLAGQIEANPATGQLTVRLPQLPQLPLSSLTISLAGGSQAALDGPPQCEEAVSTSQLVPWSASGVTSTGAFLTGTTDADPSTYYEVSGCPESPAFAPRLLAGTLDSQAGAFSPLTVSVERSDSEEYLSALQLQLPPGLFAKLAGVPECAAAQAQAGSCPAAAQIGSTAILAGAGSAPLQIPGAIYLTGPYRGAPFGLAIETDMDIGPFDLGTLTVRAAIHVDPASGALTITTDPVPQILDGIPLRLRRVSIDVDRPDFVFNPTDCGAEQISATQIGALGAQASESSPFAAGGCRGLSFAPRVQAQASLPGRGRAARRGQGASLLVRIAFPAAAQGTQANLARADIDLPRKLPARLATLQRACPGPTFASNPAACPAASVLGAATASTPALPGTLSGPVYLVSHGSSASPAIVALLQGDGVQAQLTGVARVQASQTIGVEFSGLPDLPIASVELYLPAGAHSALGPASGICAGSGHGRRALSMQVLLAAQNGAVARRAVSVALAGCPGGRR